MRSACKFMWEWLSSYLSYQEKHTKIPTHTRHTLQWNGNNITGFSLEFNMQIPFIYTNHWNYQHDFWHLSDSCTCIIFPNANSEHVGCPRLVLIDEIIMTSNSEAICVMTCRFFSLPRSASSQRPMYPGQCCPVSCVFIDYSALLKISYLFIYWENWQKLWVLKIKVRVFRKLKNGKKAYTFKEITERVQQTRCDRFGSHRKVVMS